MKILSIATNCCPTRKPAFGNDLSELQQCTLKQFARFLDENTQRTQLKRDAFIIQNQNEKVIKQNNAILEALTLLAENQYRMADPLFTDIKIKRDKIRDLRDKNTIF